MKVLSKASIYGLRALLFIASKKDQTGYVSIREISDELDISFHFLTKILQTLTQQDVLESYRGPKGGIAMKVSPEDISLATLVLMLQGDDFFDKCLLGLPGCGKGKPCPVHEVWKNTKSALRKEFESTTLAELGEKVSSGKMRLTADY